MNNLWNDKEAKEFIKDPLSLRIYTSRLLGRESALVLHGGGNTSVKVLEQNFFGEEDEILYIKGSGWDLETIEAAGFAPVKLDMLIKLAKLPILSDSDMVRLQRTAMTNPSAPNPSIEAILHAIIPFKYVDHTHADAIVTITNTPDGEKRIQDIFGPRILIVPYVMPGFILAQKIYEMTRDIDWSTLDGMVLMNHGFFTFHDDAKTSYDTMIMLVTEAEKYLEINNAVLTATSTEKQKEKLIQLAEIRQKISWIKGDATLACMDTTPESVQFSRLENLSDIATRGPLTPDHVIRTKPHPAIIQKDPQKDLTAFCKEYDNYFNRNTDGTLQQLNPSPCWAIWPDHGIISFGRTLKEASIISDIKDHTIEAIQIAEKLDRWQVLSEADLFQMEYWELEQAKLGKSITSPPLQGKIALVTGGASGIGRACVKLLKAQGAVVAALDINPGVTTTFKDKDIIGIACDLTDDEQVQKSVEAVVRKFGGLDILISNAGTFPPSESIEEMKSETWDKSIAINLTSHQRLLTACAPYLKRGIDSSVVMISSKNVIAPGPGAAAYSVAKSGQTQLARVAALELGSFGVTVNIIHPNSVFDTGIWTRDVLEKRAKHYGLTVEEYKANNILKREVTSNDVAEMACMMAGPVFTKTTGAQVPIDGGNIRVV